MTYAERWADAINETYPDAQEAMSDRLAVDGDEDYDEVERRALTKAAECLRNGVPATFTAVELDIVRHMMPAHEVHQSYAKRFVLEVYGRQV
jgi:hypothetical protein